MKSPEAWALLGFLEGSSRFFLDKVLHLAPKKSSSLDLIIIFFCRIKQKRFLSLTPSLRICHAAGMVGLLSSLFLSLVGALCAAEDLQKRRPGLTMALDALSPFRGYIGIGSIGIGFYTFIQVLLQRDCFWEDPFVYLSALFAALLLVANGGLLGYSVVQRWLIPRLSPVQQEQCQSLYEQFHLQSSTLGYLAIGLGVFHTLLALL